MSPAHTQTKRRIAILTTGGTIGSVAADGVRGADTQRAGIPGRIKAILDRENVRPVLIPVLDKISEDMEPSDWLTIAGEIERCAAQGIQSIVVTHGTDTLVYSVAAARLLLEAVEARVVFTGSIYATDHADSDVDLALRSAIEASLCEDLPYGVFVSFRTPHNGRRAWLHHALALKPLAMDQVGFESLYGDVAGEYSPEDGWSLNARSDSGSASVRGFEKIPAGADIDAIGARVLQVMAYPGQRLPNAESGPAAAEVLIVSLYHSGTASTSLHRGGLRRYIREHGDNTRILLVGYPTPVVGLPYESTHALTADGALVYADIQPHVVYVTVVLGLALGQSVTQTLAHLEDYRYRFEHMSAVGALS